VDGGDAVGVELGELAVDVDGVGAVEVNAFVGGGLARQPQLRN